MLMLIGMLVELVGVFVVVVSGLLMIRGLNHDAGPDGKLPFYAGFYSFGVVYTPVQKYREKFGKTSLYKVLLGGWVLVAAGLGTILGGAFLHK